LKNDTVLKNNQIRARRVVLIDSTGTRLGEFMRNDAIDMAKEQGLDLVQVSGQNDRPICRMVDYGKLLYDRKKKQKKGSAQVRVKELKFGPNTDEHDMLVREGRARKFLGRGDKVKITVRFRGRESAHQEIIREKCLAFAERLSDIAFIDQPPKLQGRQMMMLLSGKKTE
jgi:translation initiation factor IF-3